MGLQFQILTFACSLLCASQSLSRAIAIDSESIAFRQNNYTLQSALQASMKACPSSHQEDLLQIFELIQALEEIPFEPKISESLLARQRDFQAVVASAKSNSSPDCLRLLQETRIAFSVYLTSSLPANPTYAFQKVKSPVKIPKATTPSSTKSPFEQLQDLIEKSAKFAEITHHKKTLSRYAFRAIPENADTPCRIEFGTTKDGQITFVRQLQHSDYHMQPSISFISKDGSTDTSGTLLTVHEGHLALEEWGGTPNRVIVRWTFLTNPDGSLEKVVRHDVTEKAKSYPKIACKVIQFKTFADQIEPSTEAPHLGH